MITPEQVRRRAERIQAGDCFPVPDSDWLRNLASQLERQQARLRDWEELEARLCPEDVGFEEYIKAIGQESGRRLIRAEDAESALVNETALCNRAADEHVGREAELQAEVSILREHVAFVKGERNAAEARVKELEQELERERVNARWWMSECLKAEAARDAAQESLMAIDNNIRQHYGRLVSVSKVLGDLDAAQQEAKQAAFAIMVVVGPAMADAAIVGERFGWAEVFDTVKALVAQKQAAQQTVTERESTIDMLRGEIATLRELLLAVDEAREAAQAAQAALERYGWHDWDCDLTDPRGGRGSTRYYVNLPDGTQREANCTCGFSAALASAQETPGEPSTSHLSQAEIDELNDCE